MELRFFKLDGAGNDFIALDFRDRDALGDEALGRLARSLCDRNRGAGADGLLILQKPGSEDLDFNMRYLNADGSIGEMCGNGARCIAVFARFLHAAGDRMRFATDAGDHRAEITPRGARIHFPDIQTKSEKRELAGTAQPSREADFLWVGVPHAVLFVEELDLIDVRREGREIRFDPAFATHGANVNFAQVAERGTIHVRTYERGVEGETQACGTGAVATACCFLQQRGRSEPSEVTVIPTGGEALKIGATPTQTGFCDVTLEGPARIVFQGMGKIDDSGKLSL